MTLAVEPMITASGETDVQLDEDDGWSIYSADHSLTAHTSTRSPRPTMGRSS